MERFLASAKSFASMQEEFDEQFFSRCAREYALSLVPMLLDKYGPACASNAAFFSSIMTVPDDADRMPFWCPELGHCWDALAYDRLPAAQRGLAQVALNLLAAGVPGRWAGDFARPSRLRWGRVLLPEALRLEVDSDGGEARVKIAGPDSTRNLRFCGLGGGEPEREWPGAEAMPYLEFGRNRALLLSGLHRKELDLPEPKVPAVPMVTEGHRRNFAEALALFRKHFPSWVPWLDRVVRVITIVERPAEGIASGAVEGYYGSIWISDSDNLLHIIESLLHECSHQYFFLLSRLDALANDDGRLFYSPFVKRGRPAYRILLGYHAFTNVEMFYRECLRLGIQPAQSELALAYVRRDLSFAEQTLSDEVDLTPTGRALFDSLLLHRSRHGILN